MEKECIDIQCLISNYKYIKLDIMYKILYNYNNQSRSLCLFFKKHFNSIWWVSYEKYNNSANFTGFIDNFLHFLDYNGDYFYYKNSGSCITVLDNYGFNDAEWRLFCYLCIPDDQESPFYIYRSYAVHCCKYNSYFYWPGWNYWSGISFIYYSDFNLIYF